MLEAGEDARFIARRMIIFASEDVGMADPQALLVAVAASQALEHVGLPEAQLNLSQAAIHLATAPKSNRAALAIWNARSDVQAGAVGEQAERTYRTVHRVVAIVALTVVCLLAGGADAEAGLGRDAGVPRQALDAVRLFSDRLARHGYRGRR